MMVGDADGYDDVCVVADWFTRKVLILKLSLLVLKGHSVYQDQVYTAESKEPGYSS